MGYAWQPSHASAQEVHAGAQVHSSSHAPFPGFCLLRPSHFLTNFHVLFFMGLLKLGNKKLVSSSRLMHVQGCVLPLAAYARANGWHALHFPQKTAHISPCAQEQRQ